MDSCQRCVEGGSSERLHPHERPGPRPGRQAPLRRLERRHLPPEGSALSTELQGRFFGHSTPAHLTQQGERTRQPKVARPCRGARQAGQGLRPVRGLVLSSPGVKAAQPQQGLLP